MNTIKTKAKLNTGIGYYKPTLEIDYIDILDKINALRNKGKKTDKIILTVDKGCKIFGIPIELETFNEQS